MKATAYHLHGEDLHITTDAITHCRTERRRTLVAVGQIRGSVRRIETLVESVRRKGGQ